MNVFNKFPRTFWVANTIELLERWAWYGFFMLFANYLTGSSDMGGLEFSQSQKGLIMGIGTGILYFLPVLTGAIADRYGYKKILALSFVVYATAFVLFPQVSSFGAVFAMYIYLAVGAALFKPVVSATIAKTTRPDNSSIGFGIFYMMVNIGAFFGPMVTLLFKSRSYLIFYTSAGVILLSFVLLLFYREPDRSETKKETSLLRTFGEIFRNMAEVFKDSGLIVFLLIVSGFWAMYYQLFFTLPVFISQWIDTSSLYHFFDIYVPFIRANYSPAPGVLDAEFITNIDALFIIIFQIAVSTAVMRWKPLRSMMVGFLVCAVGMSLTLVAQNVLFTIVAILIFSIGEMSSSPKITEYIGLIAPKGKKALYMGYSYIPLFVGNFLAGFISGNVYQAMSDKVAMTDKLIADKGLLIEQGLSTNARFEETARQLNLSPQDLTNKLWNDYHPSDLWIVILSVGLFAAICLYVYDRARRNKN
jgi:dipeptide/tripeptide permease